MEHLSTRIGLADWVSIRDELNQKGYAIIPGLLTDNQCNELISEYDNEGRYRKTVVMERYRFGLGEYKYFDYPLPPIVGQIRDSIYERLAPVANLWMKVLSLDKTFPDDLGTLHEQCRENGQTKATPLILKYGKGGFNTMHQDLYGEVFFPIQALAFLTEPDKDYTGGEFVLMQQTPRGAIKDDCFTAPQR